jgi:hypothetical protein
LRRTLGEEGEPFGRGFLRGSDQAQIFRNGQVAQDWLVLTDRAHPELKSPGRCGFRDVSASDGDAAGHCGKSARDCRYCSTLSRSVPSEQCDYFARFNGKV